MPEQKNHDAVIESLIAAGVTEQLAVGIMDILVSAGCINIQRVPKVMRERQSAEIVPLPPCGNENPAFLRATRKQGGLPVLLLTDKQRVDRRVISAHDPYYRKMYGNTRPAFASETLGTLILSREKRVA